MRIISDITNKSYDTVEACEKAEAEYLEVKKAEELKKKELAEQRKARAAEVEASYKAVLEAQKIYREKLNKFCEDYGSFHMTVKTGELNPFNLFDRIFDSWF